MTNILQLRLRTLRYILPVAFVLVGTALFTSNLSEVTSAGSNGITVLTARTPREGATANIEGMAVEVRDVPVIEIFVNAPIHNAPANTYDKNAVPFNYRVNFSVCNNAIADALVIARFDAMGGHHSNYEGTAQSNWQIMQTDLHQHRACGGKKWCLTSRTGGTTLNFSGLQAGKDTTTLQVVGKWNGPGEPPSNNLDRNDMSDKAFRMGRVTAVNIWLSWTGSTPTPTPTPTTTPTPTATPTPTPKPGDPGIKVSKTDNRDITRPGHTLTYEIKVENVGDVDLGDVEVKDTVPSHLIITSVSNSGDISGQVVTWDGIDLDVDESKTFFVNVKVKDSTANGTTLLNSVEACSDDHDVCDEDDDTTLVEKPPVVKGVTKTVVIKQVPVTAKTGGAATLALTSLAGGASGLIYLKRRYF